MNVSMPQRLSMYFRSSVFIKIAGIVNLCKTFSRDNNIEVIDLILDYFTLWSIGHIEM